MQFQQICKPCSDNVGTRAVREHQTRGASKKCLKCNGTSPLNADDVKRVIRRLVNDIDAFNNDVADALELTTDGAEAAETSAVLAEYMLLEGAVSRGKRLAQKAIHRANKGGQ